MPKLRHMLYAAMVLCLCAADQAVSDNRHASATWTFSDEPDNAYAETQKKPHALPQGNRQVAQKAASAYSSYWIAPAN